MVVDPQSSMSFMDSRPIRIILEVIKFSLTIFLVLLSLFSFFMAIFAYSTSLIGCIISGIACLYAFPLTYFLFNQRPKAITGCLHVFLSFLFVFAGLLSSALTNVGPETKAYIKSKNALECSEPHGQSACKSIAQNSFIIVNNNIIENNFVKTKNNTWIKRDNIALDNTYDYLKIKYFIRKKNNTPNDPDKEVSNNLLQKTSQDVPVNSDKTAKKRASLLKKILMYPIKVE